MEAIGRLAGGIAHDFNNMLSVIMGYCEFLEIGSELSASQAGSVTEIRRAAEWAVQLTRQILAFSRKQVLVPGVVDLNSIVRGMDTLLHRLIGEDITLSYVLDPGLRQVRADPTQLEQVILNLAVNARDAMPRGGRLIIETAGVDLDDRYAETRPEVRPGRYVMLALSDTGCGMDAHSKAHAFEPFFTTKEAGKGTGLGLATVYGIVKQCGGYIYVYSEPGQGATFKIYLPAIDHPDRPAPAVEAAPARAIRGTETILLVEDDAAVRTFFQTILTRNGYTVLAAGNGEEAIRLSQRHEAPIDLMVTDVVMPQMSGRQLADRLGGARPSMRVLYLSGYTNEAVHRHGLVIDDGPFLQKPFTPSALLRKVREVLDAPPKR
jgi:two-component system cell cycle sensor histidine kinase/response regulator CckA